MISRCKDCKNYQDQIASLLDGPKVLKFKITDYLPGPLWTEPVEGPGEEIPEGSELILRRGESLHLNGLTLHFTADGEFVFGDEG